MKKLLKTMFIAFLCAITFTLSGCFGDGDAKKAMVELAQKFPIEEIDGFKVCSKTENFDYGEVYGNFAYNIMKSLYQYFTFDGAKSNVLNYDRIRTQMYQEVEDGTTVVKTSNTPWNWTFGEMDIFATFMNGKASARPSQVENYYANADNKAIDYYVMSYSVALECTIYEIMLGETVSNKSVGIGTTDGTAKGYPFVVIGATKIDKNLIDGSATYKDLRKEGQIPALDNLRAELNARGSYVGLKTEDKEKLENYILHTVIGSQIVDNASFNQNGEYQTKVNDFVEAAPASGEAQEGERSFFDPYPVSTILDYPGITFCTNGGIDFNGNFSDNTLDHIPYAEYQSVMVLTNGTTTPMTFFFAFESTFRLEATLTVRYYDIQTHQMKSCNSQTITMSGNKFDAASDMLMLDVATSFKPTLDKFDNERSPLRADEATPILGSLANYYNIEPSTYGEGGIGVINPDKMENSYLEFTIDIKKDGTRTYYPFKMGIMAAVPEP